MTSSLKTLASQHPHQHTSSTPNLSEMRSCRPAAFLLLALFALARPSSSYTLNFTGDPSSPSQALLDTDALDFVVTHRTHPKEHFTRVFAPFPADHDKRCRGPDPRLARLPQHAVTTTHVGRGHAPDSAFYICKNHLMSAMGDVSPYSIATFFPKAEWDFSRGATLEFAANNIAKRRRHWFEILITRRRDTTVAAGPEWAPIDERYPADHVVARFFHGSREIEVGAGVEGEAGRIGRVSDSDLQKYGLNWFLRYPSDPTMDDRRVRIKHKIVIGRDQRSIRWGILTYNNIWDFITLKLDRPLPFKRGVVQFKTHSYTPKKDGNMDDYTIHWSDVRFFGRMVRPYINYEAKDVAYLQRNGDRRVGESKTNSIVVPRAGRNAVLFGQVHQPVKGEVLLSVNGGKFFEVRPYSYTDDCAAYGWKSFQVLLRKSQLQDGLNTFKWKIGRRTCNTGNHWVGFSIKSLELQFDK